MRGEDSAADGAGSDRTGDNAGKGKSAEAVRIKVS